MAARLIDRGKATYGADETLRLAAGGLLPAVMALLHDLAERE